MGMAAGQARLLSITARLSDNEQSGQALSFAKQRLADEADQINREYNEALNATKLTVLTGFNGGEAIYTDISYGLLTEYNKLAGGKQYLVTDQKGKILVTDDMAKAYKKGNGDFNVFLNEFGLSQNDVDFTIDASLSVKEKTVKANENYQLVHDAWDKYLTSVGLSFEDIEHDYSDPNVIFGWDSKTNSPYVGTLVPVSDCNISDLYISNFDLNAGDFGVNDQGYIIPDMIFTNKDESGNAIIDELMPGKSYVMHVAMDLKHDSNMSDVSMQDNGLNYYLIDAASNKTYQFTQNRYGDGEHAIWIPGVGYKAIPESSIELSDSTSGFVYSYAIVNGSSQYNAIPKPLNFDGTTQEQRELYDYACALTKAWKGKEDADVKSIAKNPENAAEIQYYRNIFNQMQQFGFVTEADMKINTNVTKLGMKDSNWFEQQLRQGRLLLKTYDASKGEFVNTTYAEDSNIQEVEDDRRIAKAQIDYDQAQTALERKDKKIDLELKKLDTEHNALQTEYESVKSVVDKNIEKSFNIFS